MVKNHLKRLATNKSWALKRKENKYITKPNPGAHSLKYGFPIVMAIRDMLKLARTRKETRDIMFKKNVMVDQKKRFDHKHNVGLMDIISFPSIKKSYRIVLNKKGKLNLIEIDEKESKSKIEKIVGKTAKGKQFQLNLFDGRNVLVDKNDYKVNDTIIIELPKQKIIQHFKFEKKASILLTGGRHIGTVGVVESIEGDKLVFKNDKNEIFETVKEHAYVIGKEKPFVKIKNE